MLKSDKLNIAIFILFILSIIPGCERTKTSYPVKRFNYQKDVLLKMHDTTSVKDCVDFLILNDPEKWAEDCNLIFEINGKIAYYNKFIRLGYMVFEKLSNNQPLIIKMMIVKDNELIEISTKRYFLWDSSYRAIYVFLCPEKEDSNKVYFIPYVSKPKEIF